MVYRQDPGNWKGLYRAAMLELEPEKIQERIDAARGLLLTLEQDESRSLEERMEIVDALAALKFWERFNRK
jgi:chorismate mutase